MEYTQYRVYADGRFGSQSTDFTPKTLQMKTSDEPLKTTFSNNKLQKSLTLVLFEDLGLILS